MQLPTHFPRRLASVAAMVLAAALVPVAALAAAASPATRAAAASTPACATSGLVVWLSPDLHGGEGGGYYYSYALNFTNLSGHACTLRGSAGVSAVSLSGHQLGRSASGNYSGKTPAVRLASWATATASLQVESPGQLAHCDPVTAAGLRVYPPDQFASKVVPYPLGACSHAGPVYLSVGPVKKS
jgi:hypothetical protein